MDRTKLDVLVAAFVVGTLLLGVGVTWETYRQAQAHGEMMGHTGTLHGPSPLWYLLGAVLIAGAVAGGYWIVRDRIGAEESQRPALSEPRREPDSDDSSESDSEPAPSSGASSSTGTQQLLRVLPEDERRILTPVVDSPGLTQIELRDRAAFSKSKVSQTVTDLEKRGLLYRERQGRTYRVYPSDDLDERLT